MNKGWEVDASISYADYYYLEALVRLKRLKEKQSVWLIYKSLLIRSYYEYTIY